jgi:regulator of protease activity HflC (stomatin/prohibitin superfamily)
VDTLILVVALLLVVILVLAFLGSVVRYVTVHDYERGLRYARGRFRGLVEAGGYVTIRPFSELQVLDARPTYLTVDGQEILLVDGSSVKVSLAARYVLGDAVAAVTGDRDAWHALYVTLQLGLRDVVASRTLEQVLAERTRIGAEVRERVASDVAALGLELLAVEVRDLMVGAELRRAYASVVAARKEGEAALERARGETAALRNLANAGRLVEDNPGLLQLRILQQVGGSTGNTLMVGIPEGATRTAQVKAQASRRSPTPPARARRRTASGDEA